MLGQTDWKDWICKIKWQLISFKFIAFWIFTILLTGSGICLALLHSYSIAVARDLYSKGFITKDHLATIITHSQTVLFDIALSHLLIFFGAIMGSIVAIKGVSYWTDSKKTTEIINKTENVDDLKKFLPKKGQ